MSGLLSVLAAMSIHQYDGLALSPKGDLVAAVESVKVSDGGGPPEATP